MVKNFEGVLKKEWYREDLKALTSQIKERESLLRLKRRWLMDLPLSLSEQKRVDEMLPPSDKILPESLLREDDVGYEAIKTCIEIGFGAHNYGKEPHCVLEDVQAFDSRDGFRDIRFLLDHMTNKGLCNFLKILTGGMIKFEKTNCGMKRTIIELLPKVTAKRNSISKTKMIQLSQHLKDPKNFCGNLMVTSTTSKAYRAAAVKLLDGLEDFPSRALRGMQRKLSGVTGYIPSIRPSKSGRARDSLISTVKKMCMTMLSDLDDKDEPAERLAGALGVAGLTSKLLMNRPAVRDFRKFSPEVEVLQNDIAKAIHSLDNKKRVSMIELKKVQLLLDPNFELSIRSLRMAVRNLLTEYLYECSDMEKVPDYIVETVDIINRRSQLPSRRKRSSSKIHSSPQELMKEVIQREVVYVLTMSAEAKEVVLGLLPEHEFDEDFAHAYMEDFEESDTFCISDDDVRGFSQNCESCSDNSYGETESIGETKPEEVNSPVSTSEQVGYSPLLSPNGGLNVSLESKHITKMDSDEICGFLDTPTCKEPKTPHGPCIAKKQDPSGGTGELVRTSQKVTTKQNLSSLSNCPARNLSHNNLKNEETESCSTATPKCILSSFPVGETNIISQQSRHGNQYLQVQEACDVTSMAAYRFVGHLLDKLANLEGLVLYQGDRLYLRHCSSVPEDSEGSSKTLSTSEFLGMWKNVIEL